MEEKEGKDRRRRYWIGDTAWGLGIVAALALPVLRHSVRDRFGLFFVFFTEVEVFECIPRDWFPLPREKSWPSKGGFSRHRRRDRDAGINSVLIVVEGSVEPICLCVGKCGLCRISVH